MFYLITEWLARYEHLHVLSNSNKYINIITKHISIIFQRINNSQEIYGIQIESPLSYKNINMQNLIKKIDNNIIISNQLIYGLMNNILCIEIFSFNTYCHYLNDSDELYELLSTIMYIGLEWYIYTNVKASAIYQKLYLYNQNQRLFFISIALFSNKILEYIAKYLNRIRINLKYVKCIIYKYISNIIYLIDIDLIIKHNSQTQYIIKPSNYSIEYIISNIRHKLYHRNNQGHWRINNQPKFRSS